MKILKIFIILLLPTIGFVGCTKSDHRPAGCSSHNSSQDKIETVNVKLTDPSLLEENNTGSAVVGSGDDDRDGGDKKQKKIR